MSENKLIEKTRKVLKTQKELSEVIDELKSEVKKVYYENEELAEENELLRKKLAFFDEEKEPLHKQEKVIEQKIEVEPVEKEVIEEKRDSPIDAYKRSVKEVAPKRSNALIEFFLGKNVIAKIAIVLIFLGVISFGQIAYLEWLDDVGRVLLIMFGGFVFGGIAYYTEKKDIIVFSSVFYGLSVFTIYYSLVLGKFGFELYSNSILSYSLIVLMVGVFIYFWNKRFEFLDSVLYLFYIILGMTMLAYFDPAGGFSQYIEIIIFVSLLGYISYKYIADYYKDKNIIQIILLSIFSIGIIVYLITAIDKMPSYHFHFNVTHEYHTPLMAYNLFLYSALAIYFVYLINFVYKSNEFSRLNLLMPFFTVLVLGVSAFALSYFANISVGITHRSFATLLFVITSVPLYAFLYIKNKNEEGNFAEFYLIIIAAALLIYSFIAGAVGRISVSEYAYLNLILGIEVLIFYVLAKFTKDELHRKIGIAFIVIFVARNIAYYMDEGAFLLSESNVIFVSMGLGVLLVCIYELFKRLKIDDNQVDNAVAHSTNLLLLIPVVVTLINDLVSSDSAYIFTTVVVLLVAYRWLLEIKAFTLEYKKHLILGLNIGIILITLFLNSFYFDHNYRILEDVFKFWILFIINGYVVFSIVEIYLEGRKKHIYKEGAFLIAYLTGVFVHSIFIHNYINIEFDRVILSSYFLIASAIGVLLGFRQNWSITRKLGLGAIYFSLAKFFIYDIYSRDFSTFNRMVTYFILGSILLGISFLYAYLEKTYSHEIDGEKGN